jgi:tRNA threonylcarbamoyl adenosine modification protein YeaZ
MKDAEQITLAIESAIAGGSLSLIRGETEIASWTGTADRSKAEELLFNIDEMLTSAGVSHHDLDLIAVSAGPGSFTGIRIGIATALGLKTGLGIPMSSVSALEAMANGSRSPSSASSVTICLPVGRNSLCLQSFGIANGKVTALGEPRTMPELEVDSLANADEGVRVPSEQFVLHHDLFEKYATLPNAIDFGANIAYAIGRAASPGVVTEPLFISKSF